MLAVVLAGGGCDCEVVMAALLLGLLEAGSVGVGGCAEGGACAWLGEAIVMVCGLFFYLSRL